MKETLLKAIADTLLPGDALGLPSGSGIKAVIEALDDHANPIMALLPQDFANQDARTRTDTLAEAERTSFQHFRDMTIAALKVYYEDKRVLMAMGTRPAPPQPLGITLVPMADDLKPALERVRARGPFWREA